MDTVLGVSMAPAAVRMVLVEGENADGVTVDEDGFDVNSADVPTVSAADQVISAILGTQEGAAESGYQLRSSGVTGRIRSRPRRCVMRWQHARSRTSCWSRPSWPLRRWRKSSAAPSDMPRPGCCSWSPTPRRWL